MNLDDFRFRDFKCGTTTVRVVWGLNMAWPEWTIRMFWGGHHFSKNFGSESFIQFSDN